MGTLKGGVFFFVFFSIRFWTAAFVVEDDASSCHPRVSHGFKPLQNLIPIILIPKEKSAFNPCDA